MINDIYKGRKYYSLNERIYMRIYCYIVTVRNYIKTFQLIRFLT